MTPYMRRILGAAAARERDARERHFPRLVDAQKLTQEEADAETDAWRAIAEWIGTGNTSSRISFAEMHLFTSRCLQGLERDVGKAEKGDDPDKLQRLIERRDLVDGIHQRVAIQHSLTVEELTREARASSLERKAA